MSETLRQNEDGSWSPAEPVGFQDGLDWEVYGKGGREARAKHRAELFDGPRELAVVESRWRWLLRWRMARAERRAS